MDYKLAKAAADKAREHLDRDEAEALAELVKLFEPYKGDDANKACLRRSATCHCRNCRYETEQLFHPAVLERVALAGIRLAQCPRCFSTEMMCGPAVSKNP